MERVGQIEEGWRREYARRPQAATVTAQMRLSLLRRALRRHLLTRRASRPLLNSRDPMGQGIDFFELDALVDSLWTGTGEVSGAEQLTSVSQ